MSYKTKHFLFFVLLTTFIRVINAQETNQRIGEFTISSTVLDIMGESDAPSFASKISITDLVEWEVYVPQNYDPGKPSGILVFINSRNNGKIEEKWKVVMENTNLIYIGANNSGNDIAIAQRVAYAIIAPRLINNTYYINPDRIYVSGFSGGSRVASMVATEYNNLFKGAIYNSGANYWGEAAQASYDEMKNNYYVFITGTEDFNLEDTKQVYDAYQKIGVKNSKLIVVPNMAHKRPGPGNLEDAVNYIDMRLSID